MVQVGPYLAYVVLLLSVLGFVGLRTLYVTINQRYIPYGFDSTRIMGYAQEIQITGQLDYFASNRWGLPLMAAAISSLLGLPASEMMLLPLWLVNLGAAFWVGLLVRIVSKSNLTAMLGLWLYALISGVALINDSYFMERLILPLRLVALFATITLKPKDKWWSLSWIGYFGLAIYGGLTYPIINLQLDLFAFMVAGWIFLRDVKSAISVRLVMLSHLVSFWIMLLTMGYRFAYSFDWPEYMNRFYSVYAISVDRYTVGKLVAIFLLLQLGLLILTAGPRLVSMLTNRLSGLVKPVNKLVLLIVGAIVLLEMYRASIQLFTIMSAISVSGDINLEGLAQPLIRLVFGVVILSRPQLNFSLKTLLTYWIVYTVILNLPEAFAKFSQAAANGRFFGLYSIAQLVILAAVMARWNRWSIALLGLCLTLLLIPGQIDFIKGYYRFHDARTVANAMDFLRTQPDYSQYLVYAWYMNSPFLAPHDKYFSMAFVPNAYEWDQVKRVGQCESNNRDCLAEYRRFIDKNGVRYLIIEDLQSGVGQLLTQLGEVIYDQGIIILKLD